MRYIIFNISTKRGLPDLNQTQTYCLRPSSIRSNSIILNDVSHYYNRRQDRGLDNFTITWQNLIQHLKC